MIFLTKWKETEIGRIPEDWNFYTIDKIAEVIGGGTPSTKEAENFNGDIPWITPKDLSNCTSKYISRGERSLTNKGLQNSNAKIIPKGSVLVTTRAPVGYVVIAANEVTTNQGFHSIIPRKGFSSEYIYYLIKKNVTYLRANANGSTFSELSSSRFKQLKFPFPTLEEQKAIAKILSDLDSKIELNNQMNATLEAMAHAIFKHWFIDFEFPNEKGEPYKSSGGKMVDSELGKIPEGWKVKGIIEIASIIDCLHSKKPTQTENGPVLLQFYNVGANYLLDLNKQYHVSQRDYDFWTRNISVREGDLVITNAGKAGAIAQIPPEAIFGIGRNITAIRPAGVPPTFLLLYLTSDYGIKEISKNTDQGTIFDTLNVKGIKKLKIIIPTNEILFSFEKLVRPMRHELEEDNTEASKLARLRDFLLPKLMSGKIRINPKMSK